MSEWSKQGLEVKVTWQHALGQQNVRYTCGFCGTDTTPSSGWNTDAPFGGFRGYCLICTNCRRPSFILMQASQIVEVSPQAMMGNPVAGLPEDIHALYAEARAATSGGAYTASVLTCRKILMHVAVEKGAEPNLNFLQYVNYLDEANYIPKDAKGWVDHIRTKSNEANHEILVMSRQDALDLISFTEMLLRLTYEFLHRLPKPAQS